MAYTESLESIRACLKESPRVERVLAIFQRHGLLEVRKLCLDSLQYRTTSSEEDAVLFENIIKSLGNYRDQEFYEPMIAAYIYAADDALTPRAIELAITLSCKFEEEFDCSKQIAGRLCRLMQQGVFGSIPSLEKYLLDLLASLDPMNWRKSEPAHLFEYNDKIWYRVVRALTIIAHLATLGQTRKALIDCLVDLHKKMEGGLIGPDDSHSKFGKDVDRKYHLAALDSIIKRCSWPQP